MLKKYQPLGLDMRPSKTRLGRFIRRLRLKRKLRQGELGKLAKMPQTQISLLETGERKSLKKGQVKLIARALRCSQRELRKRMPKQKLRPPKNKLERLIRARCAKIGCSLKEFEKKMGMRRGRMFLLFRSKSLKYAVAARTAQALKLPTSALTRFVVGSQHKPGNKAGRLIRKQREAKLMSLDSLSAQLGVSKAYLSQIELGPRLITRKSRIAKPLATILDLKISEVCRRASRRKPKK
jgi:transcriptional regulator with XRE-family HTH domain